MEKTEGEKLLAVFAVSFVTLSDILGKVCQTQAEGTSLQKALVFIDLTLRQQTHRFFTFSPFYFSFAHRNIAAV